VAAPPPAAGRSLRRRFGDASFEFTDAELKAGDLLDDPALEGKIPLAFVLGMSFDEFGIVLVVARSSEREGFRVAGSGEPQERRFSILAEGVVRRGRHLYVKRSECEPVLTS